MNSRLEVPNNGKWKQKVKTKSIVSYQYSQGTYTTRNSEYHQPAGTVLFNLYTFIS